MTRPRQHILRHAVAIAQLEWRLEWRQGHQLAAVGLFALASVYVAFQGADHQTDTAAWTSMLWLVFLFSGFTAIGRLFDREREQARRYFQWTISPLGLILGKMFHALITTTALTAVVLGAFAFFLGWPDDVDVPGKPGLLVLGAWLGGVSISTTLVFVSAVASQVRSGGGALGAVLGLPLLLPQLILATRLTRGAILDEPGYLLMEYPLFLGALSLGITTIACILFPYIWRS